MTDDDNSSIPTTTVAKRSAEGIYDHLRGQILGGDLPPGSTISQVQLANQLGVSRTPLREAIRRLQQEGLIEAEVNRRARIVGFDADTLEQVYTSRILHEPLGLGITLQRIQPGDLDHIDRAVGEMRAAKAAQDFEAWETAHRDFHRSLVSRTSEQLRRQIHTSADQGERFRRLMQGSSLDTWTVWDTDHELIAAACHAMQRSEAVALLAKHLARSALSLLAALAPEHDAVQVRTALAIIAGD